MAHAPAEVALEYQIAEERPRRFWSSPRARGILLLLFGPGFLFLFWGVHAFMQNSEQRLLALYISFTDELVQHELEQHGGEAGDGA